MDYNKAALEMHESHKGKVGIVSKVEVATRDGTCATFGFCVIACVRTIITA